MIKVTRKDDENNQKLIGTFLKRVKKANQVSRIRKTRTRGSKVGALKQKNKALRIASYANEQQGANAFGKL